jgi:hypothetical protein
MPIIDSLFAFNFFLSPSGGGSAQGLTWFTPSD